MTRKDLEWFVGKEFDLTACETGKISARGYAGDEDASTLTFTLDGETYQAQEDPNDGHRSSLKSLTKIDVKLANTFPPCRVRAEWSERDGGAHELLTFRCIETELPVIEVGTKNYDDYYPCFVGWFGPEGMDINSTEAVVAREVRELAEKEWQAEVAKQESEEKMWREQKELDYSRSALGWGSY